MIKYVGKLWEKEKERQMELIDGIVDWRINTFEHLIYWFTSQLIYIRTLRKEPYSYCIHFNFTDECGMVNHTKDPATDGKSSLFPLWKWMGKGYGWFLLYWWGLSECWWKSVQIFSRTFRFLSFHNFCTFCCPSISYPLFPFWPAA